MSRIGSDKSVKRVLAAPDKFRGTATAAQVCAAIHSATVALRLECASVPLADGGEGMLAALGGANRLTAVTGPLGGRVDVPWRLEGDVAHIESALAVGLQIVGGAEQNDPVAGSTRGVGELIMTAVRSGARRVVVGAGGTSTTDGGAGAVEAMQPILPLAHNLDLVVACDVRARFVDAAGIFAPQKGADNGQVEQLRQRLLGLVIEYKARFGVDVSQIDGAGAAGGLAGGLLAVGASLTPGFDLIASAVRLDDNIEAADLVITGEGRFDATSLSGKVVGEVLARADRRGIPALVIAGQVDCAPILGDIDVIDLSNSFGQRTFCDTTGCITEAVERALAGQSRAR